MKLIKVYCELVEELYKIIASSGQKVVLRSGYEAADLPESQAKKELCDACHQILLHPVLSQVYLPEEISTSLSQDKNLMENEIRHLLAKIFSKSSSEYEPFNA